MAADAELQWRLAHPLADYDDDLTSFALAMAHDDQCVVAVCTQEESGSGCENRLFGSK